MKICILHGSPRKGNTYKVTECFKEEMKRLGEVEFTEFFLHRDMPHYCCGCFVCFEKGEDQCPHASFVQPIKEAMKEADGLILTTPVYVLAESAQMKALLDHLAHMFIPHRPMEEMFSKVAQIISTTAGAGTGKAMNPIERNLRYWGVKRIYKAGFTLFAKDWEEMSLKKQLKFEKRIIRNARRFYKRVKGRDQLLPHIFTRMIFGMMKRVIQGYPEGNLDKKYWQEKGWRKTNPF
ncbi:flavodoxin family protein [Alkaliphilus hydrothermalis]|uniref:Multimeric flavodoxin WrbA n=1 Tax=Alkaliphilus hydrothermalis TaxID=1482730 RepID=A0ABS2NLL0_9FIRM|nr:NAD(P)H-dependent oxidoreductase [Alkaliphilus hydrothermalis]MBM7613776.1 multimeric flavodoxin WrbA [Alkaliphilus hydrothermalis]